MWSVSSLFKALTSKGQIQCKANYSNVPNAKQWKGHVNSAKYLYLVLGSEYGGEKVV